MKEERTQDAIQRPEPGCGTCYKNGSCPLAMLGYFCPRWQPVEPQPRGEDPNVLWRRGEDVGF